LLRLAQKAKIANLPGREASVQLLRTYRSVFGGCFALIVLVAGSVLGAQPATKPFRIGWLSASSDASRGVTEFQQGLRDLRYIEGQNIVVEYRHATGSVSELAELAAELARIPVEVIVTSGESPALAAKRTSKSIPIVAIDLASDPVKSGLVASLSKPEGNLTGLASQSDELWPKRLGLLKQIKPKTTRLAVLWNPRNQGNASCVAEISAGATAIDMEVQPLEVRDAASLDRAFASIEASPTDALAICWDSATLANARSIAEFALKQRLPTVSPLREYVDAGALLSYGPSLAAQRRRAAYYVDRILKGVRPASLPVEQPTQFYLVVNLTTAKRLGIALPSSLVVLLDDVIQ
jgi:putative tryptophan/tyrosine transport system substrate-binding protein